MELTPMAQQAQDWLLGDGEDCPEELEEFIDGLGGEEGFYYEFTEGQNPELLAREILANDEDVERFLHALAVVEEVEEIYNSITWDF